MGRPAGIAICHDAGKSCFSLFYCDSSWLPITDTWHETLDAARKQAESEFAGVSTTWL